MRMRCLRIARCVRTGKTITSLTKYHINNGTVLALQGNRTLGQPELLLLCLPTCFVRRGQDAEVLDNCCGYSGKFRKVLNSHRRTIIHYSIFSSESNR